MPLIAWKYEDEDGVEETVHFPAKWEICERCRGEGTRDHPAFSNGITASEWAEWDDDDRDHYLSGRYDVACDECEGGKVKVIDEDAIDEGPCSGELSELLVKYHQYQKMMYYHRMECEAERRMGA